MRHQGSVDFRGTGDSGGAGVGFLRVVLLFGSAAVALSLILIPILMKQGNKQIINTLYIKGSDQMTTGSIKPDNSLKVPLHPSLPGN